MGIDKIIKKRRLELGLTLKDVAKELNVAESTVSRYESAEIEKFPITLMESLSKVLQCSPTYLMGWSDEIQPINNSHLSTEEKNIISAYRKADTIDKAIVLRTLHLDEDAGEKNKLA